MAGPLAGMKVVEFTGLGAAPFVAMMLGDMGADVVRIDRPGAAGPYPGLGTRADLIARSRRSIALDLKAPADVATARDLVARAEVLIEGFRPGVMERLGLGPAECQARNPRLTYARITGWGQTGPLAQTAGHDLNYLALTGLLPSFGRPGGPPPPPLNLIGDFGGGGLLGAFGILCAVLQTRQSGRGQVVDCAMLDGAALMGTMVYSLHAIGHWAATRGRNWVDGGAPFYDSYECADGKCIAIAPIEPAFYRILLDRAGIDDPALQDPSDIDQWPDLKQRLARLFRTRTRADWCVLLEHTDACVSPVLGPSEAPHHPHNSARRVFVEHSGALQPAPAPRFDGATPDLALPPPYPDEHRAEILADWLMR
ncbi:CaiB/BaiF CoA-transferase family protein [Gemmobacter sp.]|uniref:CaiB/BaiF CoA transferase family protein n=1 Tax=Gemmobacter sp. TaxID=1898957 RepID=UPI002AFFAFA5|nr:CaiB/BaiF CoA-transferase family protein [Gemmobacter sp.]